MNKGGLDLDDMLEDMEGGGLDDLDDLLDDLNMGTGNQTDKRRI